MINDIKSIDYFVYFFKYDFVYGVYKGTVEYTDDFLVIDGCTIPVTATRQIAELQWGALGADIVADCTGVFLTTESAAAHLEVGAKRVVMSAPAKDGSTPTFVYGVNHQQYSSDMQVVSNASCTTNALAPVASVIHEQFGIQSGLMTTIHAVTGTQSTVDGNS